MKRDLGDRELKKGSAELLILSLVETRPRHGYEIGKLIDARSDGVVRCSIASRSAAGSTDDGWRRPASGGAVTIGLRLKANEC